VQNLHLTVRQKDLVLLHRKAGGHGVVTLVTEDNKRLSALIAETQVDPVSGSPLHIDFHQVRMDERIKAKVPLLFTHEAKAVKSGFLVVETLHEIEVESLPGNLPSRLEVNRSELERPGESIYVKDMIMPAEVSILTPLETVIATVIEKTAVETPQAAAVAESPAPAKEEAPAG
jgi:large subunit ribosomal protein L25